RGVPAQVGDRQAQTPGQLVEDPTQGRPVRLAAEYVEETRHIPAIGDLVLAGEVQQSAQGRVAVQFGQASVEGSMAQGDGQEDDPPETFDGVVIATVAAGSAQASQ